MPRIARHGAAAALGTWVAAIGLVAAGEPGPALRVKADAGAAPRTAHLAADAPEWTSPPVEIAPPWVGDGTPSKDRELRLVAPRVKVLSIVAVPELSDWEPARAPKTP
jgi:hypothetical protein